MIRAHANAVLDALRAVPNLTVYDVDVPTTTDGTGKPVLPQTPYVVVFPTPGNRTAERLDAEPDRGTFDFYCNVVGVTGDQVRLIAEWVYGALAGKRLTVAGRNTWKVQVLAAEAIRPDQDVQPPVLVSPILFRLSSVPGVSA